MNGIRIECTYEALSPMLPAEWIARAFQDKEQVALGFGQTQLDAFEDCLHALRATRPEFGIPDTRRTGT